MNLPSGSGRRSAKAGIVATTLWATLCIVQGIFSMGIRSYMSDTVGKINAVLSHDLDVELSVWGASTALVHIDPILIEEELQLSAFNMGIDGSNIVQYEGLLHEYLSYTEASRFVVIALDVYGGLEDRQEVYHLHNWLHHMDNANVYRTISGINPDLARKIRYVPFYDVLLYDVHSARCIRDGVLNWFSRRSYEFPQKGANLVSDNYTADSSASGGSPIRVPVSMRAVEKLSSVVDAATQKGNRVIILITPIYVEGLRRIVNASEFVGAIQELASSRVAVIDLSRSRISERREWFYNNTHLNKSGAKALTQALVDHLRE